MATKINNWRLGSEVNPVWLAELFLTRFLPIRIILVSMQLGPLALSGQRLMETGHLL